MNNNDDLSVDGMLLYCSGIANEFKARLNRVRSFVTKHNLSSGTANETILRNFLTQLSSGSFKIGQGFICDPSHSQKVSKQCDILVYNYRDYPLVYSESGIDIVFPKAVKMVIEVKTNLTSERLNEALNNIVSAKQTNFMINGVIFAFQSEIKKETIVRSLRDCLYGLTPDTAPIAILILDKGLIIHRWPGIELGGTSNAFSVRQKLWCINR